MKYQALGHIAFCLIVAGGGIDKISAQGQPEAEIEYLAAGIADARSQWRCAQAKLTLTERVAKDNPGQAVGQTENVEAITKVTWKWQQPLSALHVEFDKKDTRTIQRSAVFSANERQATSVINYDDSKTNPKSGAYSFGKINASEVALRNSLWKDWQHLDPRYYAFYYSYTPLDEKFLNKAFAPTYKGEETIEGSRCMKVELSPSKRDRSLYWIDVEHGFLVRRVEMYYSVDDQMLLEYKADVSRVQQSDNLWAPAVIEAQVFTWGKILSPKEVKELNLPEVKVPDNKVPDNELPRRAGNYIASPPQIKRITISDFKAGCDIPAESFKINWPVWTNITDTVRQIPLLATAVSLEELDALNELRKKNERVPLEATKVNKEELSAFNKTRVAQGQAELDVAYVVALEGPESDILRDLRTGSKKKKEPEPVTKEVKP